MIPECWERNNVQALKERTEVKEKQRSGVCKTPCANVMTMNVIQPRQVEMTGQNSEEERAEQREHWRSAEGALKY
jgi:hypothetical protein